MSSKTIKCFFAAAVALLSIVSSEAQHSTSSPYSRYGIGTVLDHTSQQGRGMGGLSVGIKSNRYLNPGNPATYADIDSLNFRFELAASVHSSFFTQGDQKSNNVSGNLELIALQFPIRRWMGVSLGIMPYSVVGYDYVSKVSESSDITGGKLDYNNSFSGKGGVNQLFLGLGFKPIPSLCFGANLKAMFGTINTVSEVSFNNMSESDYYHTTTQTNSIKVRDFTANFGIQYEWKIKESNALVLGMMFEPKTKMNTTATKEVVTVNVDTSTHHFDNEFDFPMALGVGFSYNIKGKATVGFDYKLQKWSASRYFSEKPFVDKHKIIFGAEILPDLQNKKYSRRIAYRFGYATSNSYYKLNGKTNRENLITAGFGFPLKRGFNPTVLNFTIEYGFAGVGRKDVVQENTLRFLFSATINERWFVRHRLE